jgi:ribosomal protein L9
MKKILLTALLIIGSLQCHAQECACPKKVTKEQKKQTHKEHRHVLEKAKEYFRELEERERCEREMCYHPDGPVFQTIPADKMLAKIKRDSNGDRV